MKKAPNTSLFMDHFNKWDSELNPNLNLRDFGLVVLFVPLETQTPIIEYASTMTRSDALTIIQMMFPELTLDQGFGERTLQ